MKKNIFIVLLLIGFASCSNSQTKDYSTEIIGCWEFRDEYFEIKSNYSIIDSFVMAYKQIDIENQKVVPYVLKINNENIFDFQVNGKYNGNPGTYQINNDSITIQGEIRRDDKLTSKIIIQNDTLYLIASVPNVYRNILRRHKSKLKMDIPEDLKLKEMIRYTICVRAQNCDRYQE